MEGGGGEGVGPAPEGGGVHWEKADLITFFEACSGCHVEPWRGEAGGGKARGETRVLSTHRRGAVGRSSAKELKSSHVLGWAWVSLETGPGCGC